LSNRIREIKILRFLCNEIKLSREWEECKDIYATYIRQRVRERVQQQFEAYTRAYTQEYHTIPQPSPTMTTSQCDAHKEFKTPTIAEFKESPAYVEEEVEACIGRVKKYYKKRMGDRDEERNTPLTTRPYTLAEFTQRCLTNKKDLVEALGGTRYMTTVSLDTEDPASMWHFFQQQIYELRADLGERIYDIFHTSTPSHLNGRFPRDTHLLTEVFPLREDPPYFNPYGEQDAIIPEAGDVAVDKEGREISSRKFVQAMAASKYMPLDAEGPILRLILYDFNGGARRRRHRYFVRGTYREGEKTAKSTLRNLTKQLPAIVDAIFDDYPTLRDAPETVPEDFRKEIVKQIVAEYARYFERVGQLQRSFNKFVVVLSVDPSTFLKMGHYGEESCYRSGSQEEASKYHLALAPHAITFLAYEVQDDDDVDKFIEQGYVPRTPSGRAWGLINKRSAYLGNTYKITAEVMVFLFSKALEELWKEEVTVTHCDYLEDLYLDSDKDEITHGFDNVYVNERCAILEAKGSNDKEVVPPGEACVLTGNSDCVERVSARAFLDLRNIFVAWNITKGVLRYHLEVPYYGALAKLKEELEAPNTVPPEQPVPVKETASSDSGPTLKLMDWLPTDHHDYADGWIPMWNE